MGRENAVAQWSTGHLVQHEISKHRRGLLLVVTEVSVTVVFSLGRGASSVTEHLRASVSVGILHTCLIFSSRWHWEVGAVISSIRQMRKTRLRVINTANSEVAKLGFRSGPATGSVRQEESVCFVSAL